MNSLDKWYIYYKNKYPQCENEIFIKTGLYVDALENFSETSPESNLITNYSVYCKSGTSIDFDNESKESEGFSLSNLDIPEQIILAVILIGVLIFIFSGSWMILLIALFVLGIYELLKNAFNDTIKVIDDFLKDLGINIPDEIKKYLFPLILLIILFLILLFIYNQFIR